jgi:hypothetical protein
MSGVGKFRPPCNYGYILIQIIVISLWRKIFYLAAADNKQLMTRGRLEDFCKYGMPL